ncbi:MAG: hypothetical protein Fur0017_20450 [Anaerolineales bacterium]
MIEASQLENESRRTIKRTLPRIEQALKRSITKDPQVWGQFRARLEKNFSSLFALYADVYGDRMARSWLDRPMDLRGLDDAREQNPHWFQSNQMLGGVCYVDRFANNLEGHIFHGFRTLVELRKSHDVFAGGELEIIPAENEHVLAFTRSHAGKRAVIFANFSEAAQTIERRIIEQYAITGLKKLHGRNHVSPKKYLELEPLDFVVFG